MQPILSIQNMEVEANGHHLTLIKHALVLTHARIGLVGPNGSGKSTLLKILAGVIPSKAQSLSKKNGLTIGYIPQCTEKIRDKSGGEHFFEAFRRVLTEEPSLLLLDEPTNHLDGQNRLRLLDALKKFRGAIITASHDEPFLTDLKTDAIWEINHHRFKIYDGHWCDFKKEKNIQESLMHQKHSSLKKEIKCLKKDILFEKTRSAKSKRKNRNENDKTLKGFLKERASKSTSQKTGKLIQLKEGAQDSLDNIFIPKKINPKFFINSRKASTSFHIGAGSIGYKNAPAIASAISLTVKAEDRIAIEGPNGAGKSTFLKALLGNADVQVEGYWKLPPAEQIGYLDQHYQMLDPDLTPWQILEKSRPDMKDNKRQEHLCRFLFCKPDTITRPTQTLSGGEKARLCLALIAANNPAVLLLDEMTNNLDRETTAHVVDVLNAYEGILIAVSHDKTFLKSIKISYYYELTKMVLS